MKGSYELLTKDTRASQRTYAQELLMYLSGLAGIAVLALSDLIDAHIAPLVLPLVSPQYLLRGLIGTTALTILVIAYHLLRRGLRLKYGIYWDKAKNPYCPVCKKPVSYGEYVEGFGYYCKPCSHVYPLADASGKEYTPKDVQELL